MTTIRDIVNDELSEIFINKKDNTYINAIVSIQDGKAKFHCYEYFDLKNGKLLAEGIFHESSLPNPSLNAIHSLLILSKYLRKNGYKHVTQLISTKKGLKLK